ncbi:outer membrane protein assembly factor BamC [Sodalis endosymbiont of Henestaris halophilus]|uniref:outer membrane protein assembly factor BamC n=1 Tax=Sodalis endosymbiont of Henestaris halophilus TaxID=1929246 RepID=UPI000BBF8746|nr:outer membrane protein assembly factor BamC [Sodalis endosymbiont of Henestaris halophilus]SNC59080.1 Outer membrane protein assembly factor BamC precursor [Sodalis endosymbiont of Henestaris halophilus]
MAYLMQQLLIFKVVGISLILLLEACANYSHNKRQPHENEEKYLTAPSLHALTIPTGIILPLHNSDYDISSFPCNKAVNNGMDIFPPTKTLELQNDAYPQCSNNRAFIQLK